jgi:hypothetical protein
MLFAQGKKLTKSLSWLCFFAQGEKRVTLLRTIKEESCSLYKGRAKNINLVGNEMFSKLFHSDKK